MPGRRSTWGCNEDAGGGYRRLRYWADLGDGRGYRRVSETIKGSRRDGDEVLARRRVEHSQDHAAMTLGEVWERWYWPECQRRVEDGTLKPRTLDEYRGAWRKHVAPAFGDAQVTDIRPLAVQEWLDGLTEGSAVVCRAVLRQVLDVAVRYELVGHNVAAARYHMPKGKERAVHREVLTLTQMERTLAATRGTLAYLPAVLCGTASCRVGEALGATRQDVSRHVAHGMTLAVVQVRQQLNQLGEIVPTKTPQSVRPVVVPEPWSLDVLAVHTEWLCEHPAYLVPVGQKQLQAYWRDAQRDAGLEPVVTMRNMRASWRTIMRWELGVDEDKVERMMGHAGKTIGQQYYDRPDADVFCDTVAEAWLRWRVTHPDEARDE